MDIADFEYISSQRFQNITKKSNNTLKINNWFDYYNNLSSIININYGQFLLPIDPIDIIQIDLDTRQMKIPDKYQKGLFINNDHYADMITFQMPRYYDYYDLNSSPFVILIHWSVSYLKGTKQGTTVAYAIDTELAPNYITFGWNIPIDITKNAKKITFAIEIIDKYSVGAKSQYFSLNTKPTTLPVIALDNLDYSTQVELDDSNVLIDTVLQNTFAFE